MKFEIGDIVTRKSHNNDTIFVITDIINDIAYLKGTNIRLYADSLVTDLKKFETEDKDEDEFVERVKPQIDLNRDDYFYLPGKILHIDSDEDYLKRCLEYYKEANIWAMGIKENEENLSLYIKDWLEEYEPNIVVITGHDAYYKKKGSQNNITAYKNSNNFINAVKEARKFEKSHDKLIIIAGACQSDYEDLIKAGANFASSPKRINIHALDPAIIATKMSLSDARADINLKEILDNTKYGKNGMGGVITKGTMYVGYPR
ncbi:MAG: sporulation peptidase YabG [Bacilli bacterium]|nr:sporulation peptidase YabG [Bacilli bacterium]